MDKADADILGVLRHRPDLIRQAYEARLPTRIVALLGGLSRSGLNKRARAGRWRRRQPHRAAVPAVPAVPAVRPAAAPDRGGVVGRLWAVLERQLGAIEGGGAGPAAGGSPQELASLARTLERLIETERDLVAGAVALDEGPEDIDGFRDEIARRLEGLLGTGADG